MNSLAKNWKALAVAGVAALVAAYWYLSPYWAVHRMHAAAERHDAQTLNQYVDYPRLRESLKRQFAARMSGQMQKNGEGGFAAVGAALGLALVDRFIDALVTPETLMKAMQSADVQAGAGSKSDDGVSWTFNRQGADKVVLTAVRKDEDGAASASMVLERSGFADWKLTELQLPLEM